MKKFKFLGITKYAEKYLSSEDISILLSMIDCEVIESDELSKVDGKKMFTFPDGEDVHIDFLQLEEI